MAITPSGSELSAFIPGGTAAALDSGIACDTAVVNGNILTVSGITQYDTLAVADVGRVSVVGNALYYDTSVAGDGSALHRIGTVEGGAGSSLSISFYDYDNIYATADAIAGTIATAVLKALTFAITTETTAEARAITIAGDLGTDGIAVTPTGDGNAQSIIYKAGVSFDALAGSDTLKVLAGEGAVTLNMAAAGSGYQNFEVLNASAATGAMTVTLDSDTTQVQTGLANDTIKTTIANLGDAEDIQAGAGTDTLQLTDAAAVTAAKLSGLNSVEILQLADATNSVIMNAADSILQINGGTGADTINAAARTTNTAAAGAYDLTVLAGAGADVVTGSAGNDHIDLGDGDDSLTVATAIDVNDKIIGGTGSDTLTVTGLVSAVDTDFVNVTGVEKLVGDTTTTSVTLGDTAFAAGIAEVDISTSTGGTGATVDLSGMNLERSFTIRAGTKADTIKMTAANLAGAVDTITDAGGADILEITTAGTISAAKLANVDNIETLSLAGTTGDYSVAINDSNEFTAITSATSGNVAVNASAETAALSITTLGGNDTITAGSGAASIDAGNGNNTITLGAGATNSVTAGSGDDTVTLGTGAADTVALGGGINTVNAVFDEFTVTDKITGTDVTLAFSTAVTGSINAKLHADSTVSTIKLGAVTTDQTVTLGAAADAVTTVDATGLTTGKLTADLTAIAKTGVTVKGGDANDTVRMIGADLTATSSIQGGTGSDTLEITDQATVVDADFTLSSSLEKVTFTLATGANTVAVGDLAFAAGVRTIDASAVTDAAKAQTITVNMTTDADMTIKTGAGADTVTMKGTQLTSGDTINGGGGTDTLQFSDGVNLVDTAFINVDQIEKLTLQSAATNQKLVLGTNAKDAGIQEVNASATGSVEIDAAGLSGLPLKITTGAGADTITVGNGLFNIDAGEGSDAVKLSAQYLTSADIVSGGADATANDTDTLEFTDGAALLDSSFTNITAFETLKLADAASQTLVFAAEAKGSGITTVDASALTSGNGVTITLESAYNPTAATIIGGDGDDILKMTTGALASTTYVGRGGSDIVKLTDAATLSDSAWAKLQDVQAIELADVVTAQNVVLGTNAQNGGVTTVRGTGSTAGNITVDASAMTSGMTITTMAGNDTVLAGQGNDAIVTAEGDDLIQIDSQYFNSADYIAAGTNTTNGKDVLQITTATAAIGDSAFTNVLGIEQLKLSANALYNVTLAGAAEAAFGGTKLDLLVTGTGGANINLSAITAEAILKGGSGAETVDLGAQIAKLDLGGGNDVIRVTGANLTAMDIIDAGAAADTIEITDATSGVLTDADFEQVYGVETLKLAVDDTQNVALGDRAISAGIRTVDASVMKTAAKTLTVNMSGMSSNVDMTVNTGYGNDTIKIKDQQLTIGDTIAASLGSDTIEISGTAVLVDADFTNVSGVETLTIATDTANQSLVLGAQAAEAGIRTIDTTAVDTSPASGNAITIDVSGMLATDLTINTGNASDLIKIKSAELTSADHLSVGTGTEDVLELTTASELTAADMANLSGFETLKLADVAGTQSVVLAAGKFGKVDGSGITGTDAITVDASGMASAIEITTAGGNDLITAGTGLNTIAAGEGSNTIKITYDDLTDAANVISAGSGADTLELTGTAKNLVDGDFSDLSGIETIKVTGSASHTVAIGTTAKGKGVNVLDAGAATGVTTLDASAFTGNVTLIGGSGANIIKAGTAGNSVTAGAGDDEITIDATTLDANDLIDGGDGNDTLILTGIANLDDLDFTNLSNIESIKLANTTGQTVIMGAQAKESGIRTIDTTAVAGGKSVTIDSSDMTATDLTLNGANANHTVKIKSAELTSADHLSVGTGNNLLELTTTSELTANDMTNLSGFDTLKLANVNTAQSVTLADGKFSLVDGSGVTALAPAETTVDATAVTGAIEIKTAGGNDVITTGSGANTVSAGSGADTIKITASTLAATDIIDGGLGNDTLEISGTENLADAVFAGKTSLDVVTLMSDGGTNRSLTLSTNADAAGIKEIDTQAVDGGMSVNVSGMSSGVKITAGDGNDTITMGSGNDDVTAGIGNDTISVASTNLGSADQIDGTSGTDTLLITGTAAITDDMVAGVSNIDTLKLSDSASAQSVTLGANARSVGVSLLSVDTQSVAGGHAVTVDVTAMSGVNVTVTGGAGDETVRITDDVLTAADTITLGAGADTLELTDITAITDKAVFTGVSGVNTVKLGDFNNTLTLKDGMGTSITVDASAARGSNKSIIDASDLGTTTTTFSVTTSVGNDEITLGNTDNTVVAGEGSDTVKVASAHLISTDSIDGGDGTDELWITTATGLTDGQLTGVVAVEKLLMKADADQSVTLGNAFADNAFTTVDASALTTSGHLSLDITGAVESGSGNDIDVTIIGGALNDTITLDSINLTATDSINMGNGTADELIIKDGAGSTVTDAQFTLVTNTEKLTYNENFNHSLTLGDKAKAAGIRTVDATALTTGKLSLDTSSMSTDAVLTVQTGGGNDEIILKAGQITSGDLLQLGAGDNLLKIAGATTLANADFNAANSGIDTITYTTNDTQSLTVGTNLIAAGLSAVDAGALTSSAATIDISAVTTSFTVTTNGGNDVITAGSGLNTIHAGGGNDTIKIAAANLGTTLATYDIIDGEGGDDTLEITAGAALTDAAFTSVSSVKTLKIQGAFNLVYADEAAGAGISVIDAANAGAKTINLSGLSADNTMTVTTGAADDTITMQAGHLTSGDTIDGGAHTIADKLVLKGAVNLNDGAFSGVTNIETLTLSDAGAHTLVLGDEATKNTNGGYIRTVDASAAGANTVTIDLSSMSDATAIMNVTTGIGNDVITIQAAHLSGDTIDAGTETSADELVLKGTVNLTDSAFADVTGIEKLTLADAGAHTLVLGDNATKNSSGGYVRTVDASAAGANSVSIDLSAMSEATAVMNITTGIGNDTIKMNGTHLTSADTVGGGNGTDVLNISTADNLVDADFTNVTSIETLILSQNAAQSVILGTEATDAGIVTVNASAVITATFAVSVDAKGMSTNKAMNITTGAGDDTVTMKASHITSADTINMGTGSADTLVAYLAIGTNTLAAGVLANVDNVDILKVTNDEGANVVHFDDFAKDAGITKIDATGNVNSGYGTTVDMSTLSDANNIALTFDGGEGDDLIKMKSAHLSSADVLDGKNGNDTLEFTTAITSTDGGIFDNVTIEKIVLAAGNNQSVTLGDYNTNVTVDAATNLGATDSVTIDASAMTTKNLTLTTKGGADSVKLGAGADTVTLAGGIDSVEIASANLNSSDTINFGADVGVVDTLTFTSAVAYGLAADDARFTNIEGLDKIILKAATVNTLNLGNEARDADIKTVDGSLATSLALTLSMDSDIAGVTTIKGGSGNDTVTMKAAHLTSNDHIDGGTGVNTLEVTGQAILDDGVFVNIDNIQKIKLDDANQDITLGSNAVASGINEINAVNVVTGNIRLDVSAFTSNMTIDLSLATGTDTIVMGQGDDTIRTGGGADTIRIAAEELTSADVIDGGGGVNDIDVLEFTSAINSTDKGIFTQVSGIETIKLFDADAQTVTLLGTSAVKTVDASVLSGNNSVTVNAGDMSSNLTVTTGSGNDTIIAGTGAKHTIDTGSGADLIRFASASEITAANDVIKGGDDVDTLELTATSAQTITNTFFGAHISGIETIKLANANGHSIDLTDAAAAMASGLTTIDTTAVAALSAASIKLGGFTTSMSVLGGAGNETVIAGTGSDTLDLGAGNDSITITTLGWKADDTITMGEGSDTLTLSDAGTVDDLLFTNVSGLEKLVLLDKTKDKTVTLGTAAKASGLSEIDATALVETAATLTTPLVPAKKAVINAGVMTNNMTIKTGEGGDTVTMGRGDDTIITGKGDDTVQVSTTYFTAADTITGGDGNDTLLFTNAANITEDKFGIGAVTGIETIKLSNFDNQSIILGDKAVAAGIATLNASALTGANRATIEYATTANITSKVLGGTGDDTVKLKSAHFDSADSLALGTGNDTIHITDAATVIDDDFTAVTGAEVLKLSNVNTATQSVTVAGKAKTAGIVKIDASLLGVGHAVTVDASGMTVGMMITTGAGNDTVKAGTVLDTIMTGEGNDTLEFLSATLSGDVIDAGNGIDTIKITNLANITDVAFGATAGVETLQLTDQAGESKVTVGTTAASAGINKIDASALTGTNKATIDASLMSTNLNVLTGTGDDTLTLGSGVVNVATREGADTIKMAAASFTAADTIDGGVGTDTLWITTASKTVSGDGGAVEDADFALVSNVETLKLSNFADQTVTLAGAALLAGINKVDAALLAGTNKVTIDTTALDSAVTLIGGAGADTFKLGTSNDIVQAGSGDDRIDVANSDWTSFDAFDGGVGVDTLFVTDAATIADDDFTGVANLETVKLGAAGAGQSIVLGTTASVASVGLKTIDATLASSTTINASAATIALIINSGSGNDVISASKGANTISSGAGDDTIKISSVGFDATDKIDGGAHTTKDILEITDKAVLTDTMFTNINGIEELKLNNFAAQSVTLGLNAQTKGITNIDALSLSSGNGVSINTAAMTTNLALNIKTGAGNDVITLKKGLLDGSDTLIGGSGTDTLVFTDTVSLTDTDFDAVTGAFKNVSSFEKIALGNFTGQTLTLGTNAAAKNISIVDLSRVLSGTTTVTSTMAKALTVVGSNGVDTITTADGAYADNLSGGAGNDTFTIGGGNDKVAGGSGNDTIRVKVAGLNGSDQIDGGDGLDVVEFIDATAAINDVAFSGVTMVETIKIAAGSTLNIGTYALDGGVTTIDMSAGGGSSVNASAFEANLTVNGSAGIDTITAGQGTDTLNGAAGDDVYQFASATLTSTDKIVDTAGTDTLRITDLAMVNDSMFTGIRGVEKLKLGANVAGQSITVGALAAASGLKTIDISDVADYTVTLNTSLFTGSLEIISNNFAGGTYKGGTGADTFSLTNTAFDATTTISGSTGTDTLNITDAATVTDGEFAKTTGVEVLKLSAGGSATLGTTVQTAGITTVDLTGSSANSTVNASAITSGVTVKLGDDTDILTTGAAADTVIVAIADLNDTANMGSAAGTTVALDTLSFSDAGVIVDGGFVNVDNIEVIKFAQEGLYGGVEKVNTVTLAGNASDALSSTQVAQRVVDASLSVLNKASTFSLSGMTKAVTFKGGAGNETIAVGAQDHVIVAGMGNDTIQIAMANLNYADATLVTPTLADAFDGGLGTDTLEISGTAGIEDNATRSTFGTGIKGIEVIKLKDGGTVELGAKAQAALISTIDLTASTANSTVTSTMTSSVVVKLGSKTDTITTGTGADTVMVAIADMNDTMDLGGGTTIDTLSLTTAGSVSDAQFTNVVNVETLNLAKGSNTVTLAAEASGAGFKTVDATASSAAGEDTTITVTGMSTAITLNLGAGNDVVTMGNASAETVIAGLGDDVIKVASAQLSAADTINGGANTVTGVDTLEITSAAEFADTVLANKSGIEMLKLAAGTTGGGVVLGVNAGAMGLTTVMFSAGSSVDASTMSKALIFKNTSFSSADTLKGGTALTDVIEINGAAALGDAAFTNVSGIEALTLKNGAAAQSVTLGETEAAPSGIVKVDASATGSVSITNAMTTNKAMTFIGGAGNDTFTFASATFDSADTVTGGAGAADTLVISDNATIIETDFTKVTGVEVLTLSGTGVQDVTVGETAKSITTINAAASSSASITNTMTTNVAMTLTGGAGNDTFTFKNATFDALDTVVGGGGTNTIKISDNATIVDTDFTLVTGVSTLKVSNYTGQTLTLGEIAGSKGVVSVDATGVTTATNTVMVDVSSMTTNRNITVTAGGATTLNIKNAHLTSDDTFTGSVAGIDTIQIADAATVVDGMFNTNFTNLDGIKLGNFAGQSVTLGANAMSAGLKKIDASLATSTVSFNMTGSGNNNLTLLGGSGADVFQFAAFDALDTISGGSGVDTIEFNDVAALGDAAFTNVGGVENLTLKNGAAAQSVTLGETEAAPSGIVKVDASATGSVSITNAMTTNKAMTFIGGAGNDTFTFASATFDSADTVTGGAGAADTLVISDNATILDTDFTNVTGVEVLDFNGTGVQNIVVAELAKTAGITKVDVSASSSATITNNMTTNVAMTMIGGAGADTFVFKSATFDGSDSINGGSGANAIKISDLASVVDTDFAQTSNVQTLKLSAAGGSVTLAGNADAVLTAVDASLATAAVIIDARAMSNGLNMIGGSAADKFYSTGGNDTITGGLGSDVIVYSSAAAANGNDTVNGFIATGTDKLAISGIVGGVAGSAMSGADYALYVSSVAAAGTDTLVTLTGGDTITLVGVVSTDVTVADFIYG